jgi:hypothetical protein
MGLIVEDILYSVSYIPQNFSALYIIVPKNRLSQIYEIPNKSIVTGVILNISPLSNGLKELLNKEIKFILGSDWAGDDDLLFISKESWEQLRDYGILPKQCTLKIKLTKVTFGGATTELYPKRDIQI